MHLGTFNEGKQKTQRASSRACVCVWERGRAGGASSQGDEDAGEEDAGEEDEGEEDTGDKEAGDEDEGDEDAGNEDAAEQDAEEEDEWEEDAGDEDAREEDAGDEDAEDEDAGEEDAAHWGPSGSCKSALPGAPRLAPHATLGSLYSLWFMRAVVLNELEQELCCQGIWWLSPPHSSTKWGFLRPSLSVPGKKSNAHPPNCCTSDSCTPQVSGSAFGIPGSGKRCYLSQLSLKCTFATSLNLLAYVL